MSRPIRLTKQEIDFLEEESRHQMYMALIEASLEDLVFDETRPSPRPQQGEHHSRKESNVSKKEQFLSIAPKGEKYFESLTALQEGRGEFGDAIRAMNWGRLRVARKGWNGKGIFIEVQKPDENSKMTSPYIFIDTTGLQTTNPDAPRSRVPWIASQTDMLAEDWQVVE